MMAVIAPDRAATESIAEVKARVDTIDWASASTALDARGNAVIKALASPAECRALSARARDIHPTLPRGRSASSDPIDQTILDFVN